MERPRWMREMFQELRDMLEELFPAADTLNLEEMQHRLDELEQPPTTVAEQPSSADEFQRASSGA